MMINPRMWTAFIVGVLISAQTVFAQIPANSIYAKQERAGYTLGRIANLRVFENALNFVVVGDWGRQGEYNQKAVALQMAKTMAGMDGNFVISTGDNVYPNGVASVQDPLWWGSFESVYTYAHLQRNWYPVLGNHDYGGNVDAQIEYSKISRRWRMPARYYSLKKRVGKSKALFVFIDTNGFEPAYYKNEDLAPALSQQDTTAQIRWLREVLADPDPSIRWKIVVGHHPLYSAGKRVAVTGPVRQAIKPILDEFGVDIYLCGHDHDLQYNKPVGPTHHFLSGAGSETDNNPHKTPENVFYNGSNGFMAFSITENQFLVQIIDYLGQILFSRVIPKNEVPKK
ncbi:metallophosphoesterase [Arsenicibacter rosenii]|nr:metallophosphoesterase [Arsenicibacter rosenii]